MKDEVRLLDSANINTKDATKKFDATLNFLLIIDDCDHIFNCFTSAYLIVKHTHKTGDLFQIRFASRRRISLTAFLFFKKSKKL